MFTVEHRDHVRDRLLSLAEADPVVTAAAIVGSLAADTADRWSDLDLAFAIDGAVAPALESWTSRLYRDFDAVHHWDLRSGPSIYRVFLLPGWLEVDLSFTPDADFGPRGPHWRTVFGHSVEPPPAAASAGEGILGLAWHHALHARVSIERNHSWQAHYWIGAVRDYVIAMACQRLGHPAAHAKGAHLLPSHLTESLEPTLIRSLDEQELRRALEAVVDALATEMEQTDPETSTRLSPMLAELVIPGT
jgi:hypothetical protein